MKTNILEKQMLIHRKIVYAEFGMKNRNVWSEDAKTFRMKSWYFGPYGSPFAGLTTYRRKAIFQSIVWTIQNLLRTARLNHYHYGNIFGFGTKITDDYERKLPA